MNIVQLINSYGIQLTNAGSGKLKCKCPFHNDKTPSLIVYRETNSFHCFGCGVSGDIYKFVMEIENVSFKEAKKRLGDEVAFDCKEIIREPKPKLENIQGKNPLSLIAKNLTLNYDDVKYLQSRGLSYASMDKFQIFSIGSVFETNHLIKEMNLDLKEYGFLNENNNPKFVNRIMFPIFNLSDQMIAFSGRSLTQEPKYLNSINNKFYTKSQTLFGFNFVKDSSSIAICEGNIDCILLQQIGIPAVALTGTSISEEHFELLKDKEIWLIFDGDPAGLKATQKYSNRVKYITLLENGDDPASLIQKGWKKDDFLKTRIRIEAIEYKFSRCQRVAMIYHYITEYCQADDFIDLSEIYHEFIDRWQFNKAELDKILTREELDNDLFSFRGCVDYIALDYSV